MSEVLHIQLIEKAGGDWVAVAFPGLAAAREFQDQVEASASPVTFRGCVPLVTSSEALAEHELDTFAVRLERLT